MSTEGIHDVVRSGWAWMVFGVMLGLILASGGLTAQEKVPAPAAPTQDTTTVYLRAHGGKDTAKVVNEACKTYAPAGWAFADLEPYVENGDQKGVWVTFVKPG